MRKDDESKFERQFSNSNQTMTENTKSLFARKQKKSKTPKYVQSTNPFDDQSSFNHLRYPSFIVPNRTPQKDTTEEKTKDKNKKKQSKTKQLQIVIKPTFSEHDMKKLDEDIDGTIIEILKYQNIVEDPTHLDYHQSEELIRCHSLMSATTEPLLPTIEPINITPIKKKQQKLSYAVNYKWIAKQASILKTPNKEKTKIFVSGSQFSIHTIMKSLLARAVTSKPSIPEKIQRIYDIDNVSSETILKDKIKECGIMAGKSTKNFIDKAIMVGAPNCTIDCNRSIMVGPSVLIEGNKTDQCTNTEDPNASKKIQTKNSNSPTNNTFVYNTHSRMFTIFHMAKESPRRDHKVKKLERLQHEEEPKHHDPHEENGGQDHQAIEKVKSTTEKLHRLKTIANKPYLRHLHRHIGDGDAHIFKNIEIIAYPLMKFTFKPTQGFCGMEDKISSDSDDQSAREKKQNDDGRQSLKRIHVDRKMACVPKPPVKDVEPRREVHRPKPFPVRKVIEKPHQFHQPRFKQASPAPETKYLKIQDDVIDLIKKLPMKPPGSPRKPTPSSSRQAQNRRPLVQDPWRNTLNTSNQNKPPLVKVKTYADRDNKPIIPGFEKDMKPSRDSFYRPRKTPSPKRRPTSSKTEHSETIHSTQSMSPIEESKLLGKICSARDNLTKYTVQSMDLLKPMIEGGKLPSIEGLLDDYLMKSGELQTSNQNLMSVLMQQLCLNYELNRHLDATIKRINNGSNGNEYKLERPDLQNLMRDAELISKPGRKEEMSIDEITVEDTQKTVDKRTKKSLKHQKQKAEILEFCQVLRQLRKEDQQQESKKDKVKVEDVKIETVMSPQQSSKLTTEVMEEKILERLEQKPKNSREEIMTKHLKLMARKLKESGIIHIDSLEDELDGLVEKYYKAKSENSLESSTLKNVSSCFSDLKMAEDHRKKVEERKPLNVQRILQEMTAMVKRNLKEAIDNKAPEASIQELQDIEAILAHHEENMKDLHVGRKVHDKLPVYCQPPLQTKKPTQANSTIPVVHINEDMKKIPHKPKETINVLHLLNTKSFTSTTTLNSMATQISEVSLEDVPDEPLIKKNSIHCSKSDDTNACKKASGHSQSTLRAVSSLTSKLSHAPPNFDAKREENTSNDVPSLENSEKPIASLKVSIEPSSSHQERKIMEIASKETILAKTENKKNLLNHKEDTKMVEDGMILKKSGTNKNLHEIFSKIDHKESKIIQVEMPLKKCDTKRNLHDVLTKMDHKETKMGQKETKMDQKETKKHQKETKMDQKETKLDQKETKMGQKEVKIVEDGTPLKKSDTKKNLHEFLTKMDQKETKIVQNGIPLKITNTNNEILTKIDQNKANIVQDEAPLKKTDTKKNLHDVLTNMDEKETKIVQDETPLKKTDTKTNFHDVLTEIDQKETNIEDDLPLNKTNTKRNLLEVVTVKDKEGDTEEAKVLVEKTILKKEKAPLVHILTPLAKKKTSKKKRTHEASTMMDEADIQGLIVAKAEMEPHYAKILIEVINAMDVKDENSNQEAHLSIETKDSVHDQRPKFSIKNTEDAIDDLLSTARKNESRMSSSNSMLEEVAKGSRISVIEESSVERVDDFTQKVQHRFSTHQHTQDDYATLSPTGGYADKWLKRTSRNKKFGYGYTSSSKRPEDSNIMATKLRNLIDLETDKRYNRTYAAGNHNHTDDLRLKQPKVSRPIQVQTDNVLMDQKRRPHATVIQKTRITKDAGTVMDGPKGVIQERHLEISTSKQNRYLVPEVLVELAKMHQKTITKGNAKGNTKGNTNVNTKRNTKGVTIEEIHEGLSIEEVASEPVQATVTTKPLLVYPKSNDTLIKAKMKTIQDFFGMAPSNQLERIKATEMIEAVKRNDDLPTPIEDLKKSDDVLMEEFKARTIKSVIESIIHEMTTREPPIAKLNSVDKDTNTKVPIPFIKPENLQIETKADGVDFNLPPDCQKTGTKFNVFYNFPHEPTNGKWPNRISYKLVEDRVNDKDSYLTESLTFVKRTKIDGRSRMYFEERRRKAEELRSKRLEKTRPRRNEFNGKTKEEILQEGIDRYKTLYGFGEKPMSADQKRQKVKSKLEDGHKRVRSECMGSSSQKADKRKVTKEDALKKDEPLKNRHQGKARTKLPRPILKRQDCAVKIRKNRQLLHHAPPPKVEAKPVQAKDIKVCFKKDQGTAVHNKQLYIKPNHIKPNHSKQVPVKQFKPKKIDGADHEKIPRSKNKDNLQLIEEIHVGKAVIEEPDDSSSSSEISEDSGWTEMVKIDANKKIKIYRVKDDGTTCILENLFDKALGRDVEPKHRRLVDKKCVMDSRQSNRKPFWCQMDGYPLSCDPGYPFSYPEKKKDEARRKKMRQVHRSFNSEASRHHSQQASNSGAVAEAKVSKNDGRIWTKIKDTPQGRLIVNSITKIKVPYLRFWRSDNM